MTARPMTAEEVFHSPAVQSLRADLALALRAAAHHGLSEGICNHFSVEVPGNPNQFLLNPRGLHWSEVQADDIVMIDGQGNPASFHSVRARSCAIWRARLLGPHPFR